jgi:2-oxoglutarate dehydrogenase E2 component (dihydrolipoamide succinyltransferase)
VVSKRAVVVSTPEGDSIAVRSMVYLALSYDHRLVDGADASRYLVDVKTRLEEANFEPNLGI